MGAFINNGYTSLDEEAFDESADFELDEETSNALQEQFLIDEISQFTDEEREEFLESELCESLLEAGKMRRNTIVFLSGKDDMARRTKMSVLALAKQRKDPLFEKLRINRVKERKILSQLMKKYGNKGKKIAKKSQKDWIRNRMPKNFGRFGGSDRISNSASAGSSAGNVMKPRKHNDGLTW
jgi:hypothetical protein